MVSLEIAFARIPLSPNCTRRGLSTSRSQTQHLGEAATVLSHLPPPPTCHLPVPSAEQKSSRARRLGTVMLARSSGGHRPLPASEGSHPLSTREDKSATAWPSHSKAQGCPTKRLRSPPNGWDHGASGPDEPGGRPEKAGTEGGRSEQDCTPVTPPLQPSTPTLAAQRIACTSFSLALLYGASGVGVNDRGHNLPARPR